MLPKRQETIIQNDLFKIALADLLNPRHGLILLAGKVDWRASGTAFGEFFTDGKGAPALPTRLVAGLHYLKHAFGHSDEEVVALWVENPYWQYLCGECLFQRRLPCRPTPLTKWRNRIGEAGCEGLLSMTIQAGVDTQTVNPDDFQSVTVDGTVQEKAVAYPTDGKLYERCRQHLVRLSRRYRIKLRQNYNREAPFLLLMANRCHGAKQMRRKRKALKQLKTLAGRVQRDVERQLLAQPGEVRSAFGEALAKTRRILGQQRQDKGKLYSFHAPEAECVAKGKVHKKHEFGVKVGTTVTDKSNFVPGARSFPGNPYDGHTLESCLEQAEILCGARAKEVFVDLGCRGVGVPNVIVYKARQKRGVDTRRLKRALKRRNAIEPVIGHLKNDGLLRRSHLKGELGDAMHTILCGAGHNIRLILRQLRIFLPWLRWALSDWRALVFNPLANKTT